MLQNIITTPKKIISSSSRAFSLVEVLFVAGAMTIMLMIGLVSYRGFEKKLQLNTTADELLLTLQEARGRTLASKNNTTHGVHYEVNSYTLYEGFYFDVNDPNNETHILPASMEIYTYDPGGSNNAIFQRLTGESFHARDIGLRLISDPSQTKIIQVLNSGSIGYVGTLTTTNTRLTDSRHAHFSFNWSLQTATTLTLTFSDPPSSNVVQNITMLPYFNSAKTLFDWSGTVDVHGTAQILRIHTHSLDAFNTQLSINRDGRDNNKALTVAVDGKQIASYTAAGVATVGAFGGTMSVQ